MPKQKQSIGTKTVTKTVTVMRCPKCGHEWEPRKVEPRQCPGCNFRLYKIWNQQKETK